MAWMRHKPDNEPGSSVSPPAPASATPAPTPQRQTPPPTPREAPVSTGKTVNIGPSVQIKGTLSGREDLTVDGRVEGKITLREHILTIGANGHIEAELQAKAVVVHGKVVGNIHAENRVEIAASGTVHGDIRAPRVSIADGAMFRGSIDMDARSTAGSGKDVPGRSESHVTKELPATAKAAS